MDPPPPPAVTVDTIATDQRAAGPGHGAQPPPFLFGEGLSFSTFATAVRTTRSGNFGGRAARFEVNVTNSGGVAAQQTVLLFARAVDVEGAPLPVEEGDLWAFYASESPHETGVITGSEPRIICGFGWSVAPGHALETPPDGWRGG